MIILVLTIVLLSIFPVIYFSFLGSGHAQTISTLVWYMLIIAGIIHIFQSKTIKGFYSHFYNLLDKARNKWVNFRFKNTFIIALVLIFLLISGFQKTYYLGGDDTRLFYIYPEKFYDNFVSNIATDTSISGFRNFLSANSISLFLYFVIIVNRLISFLNLQSFMYSLNIALGFYFFYLLFKYLTNSKIYDKKIALLVSFMYVFSIFNFYTLFNSRLISIYILSVFPLSIYLFIRSVREAKFYYTVLLSIILSVFAVTSVASFWFFASLITVIPILFYYTWGQKLRFIRYTLGLVIFLMLINLHWLIYLPYGTLFSTSGPGVAENSILSTSFITENIHGIESTADKNSVFYPILNTFHFQIQKDFNWPYLPIFQRWYLKILPLNLVFIGSVLLAGLILRQKNDIRKKYILFACCFMIAIYFFTVNMGSTRYGNWGIDLFSAFTKYIPGFIVFRNMYDKFAHALAFNYALVFGYSLLVIRETIKKTNFLKVYLSLVSIIIFLNSIPYLMNWFNKVPIWTTRSYFLGVQQLDRDYLELVEYVKGQKYQGKYLSLPLNRGNLALIEDENQQNQYYSGLSPLLILTGKNDLSGVLSFGPFSEDLMYAILDEDPKIVQDIVRKLNARFVIVKKDVPVELQRSYIFSDNFYELQDDDFISQLTGDKLQEFGKSYDLYEINDNLMNEKIFISDELNTFPDSFDNVSYVKIHNAKYQVNISSLNEDIYLIFLEPFLKEWELYFPGGTKFTDAEHLEVFDYANGWRINPEMIKENYSNDSYVISPDGSISLDLIIYFKPYENYYHGWLISLSAIVSGMGYVFFKKYKDAKTT